MGSTVKVWNECLAVYELQILNMILAVLQTINVLRDFVQYVFVNFAPAVFDAVSKCMTAMAAVNHVLDVNSKLVYSTVLGHVPIVMDRGNFLHTVWNTHCTYADEIESYVSYVQRHQTINYLVIKVFDGYGGQLSTKVVEQSRRASKVTAAAIAVLPQLNTSTTQAQLLRNGTNKTLLFKFLLTKLRTVGILTHEPKAYAYNLLVSTGFEYINFDLGVHVVFKDGNFIIALLHCKPSNESIKLVFP